MTPYTPTTASTTHSEQGERAEEPTQIRAADERIVDGGRYGSDISNKEIGVDVCKHTAEGRRRGLGRPGRSYHNRHAVP